MAASEEARRRIVEAAAALHASHGAAGTSHAMIAEQAGVSLPTVYKYFPTANDLIPACTGLVASRSPVVLDGRLFDGLGRVPARVKALASALYRAHEYFAPWLRWTESAAAGLPALRRFLDESRAARRHLVRVALQAPGGRPPSKTLVLLAEALLDYPAWRTLTSGGLSTEHAAATAAGAVIHLVKGHRP